MSKPRKITVRFYLNKDVKARHPEHGEGNLYPIYCRVTFNRSNTKFKWRNELIEERAEDEIMHSEYGMRNLQRDERLITDIVRFEEENLGDKFVLSGLGNRIPSYQLIILFGFEKLLDQDLDFFVGRFLVHNEFKEWSKLALDDKLVQLEEKLKSNKWEKLPDLLITQILAYKLLRYAPSMISVFEWIIKDGRKLFKDHLVQLLNMSKTGKKVEVFENSLIGNRVLAESFVDDVTKIVDQHVIQILTHNYQKNMGLQEVKVEPAKRKLRVR